MSDTVPKKWVAAHMTSQQGKTAIITGANTGIGYFTALELARHGANVILACRTETKGREAVQKIQAELKLSPGAGDVEFRSLDVSSLASVQAFSENVTSTHARLDLLINNAGISAVPYTESVDGIESQFATNHLGHFALTARLMPLLKQSPNARIVSITSLLHRDAKMDLDHIVMDANTYDDAMAYHNSKLYNLLFTFELTRRLRAAGIKNVLATAAHPGIAATNMLDDVLASFNWFKRMFVKMLLVFPITGTSEMGALPTLYAATVPTVKANDLFGPDGWTSTRGYPAKEEPRNVSKSAPHALKLWEESERLSKLKFEF